MKDLWPTFDYECDVLEYTSRPYNRKDGSSATYSSCLLRLDGRVMKFGVNAGADLKDVVDKTVTLRFQLTTWGEDLKPSLKVAGIV